jgi:hypothetical protein
MFAVKKSKHDLRNSVIRLFFAAGSMHYAAGNYSVDKTTDHPGMRGGTARSEKAPPKQHKCSAP